MTNNTQNIEQSNSESVISVSKLSRASILPLVYLLLFDLLVSLLVAHKLHYRIALPEYTFEANQLIVQHAIKSTFLPIGYSALLALALKLGGNSGVVALNIVFYLSIVALAYSVLLVFGARRRYAITAALLISFDPSFLFELTTESDTFIAVFCVLSFVLLLTAIARAKNLRIEYLALGFVLGLAILVRPNLLVLFPLLWWTAYKAGSKFKLWFSGVSTFVSVAIYILVTAVVHGSVFLPYNATYNLFAGTNQFTQSHLKVDMNAESSIIPALASHGITATLVWGRDYNLPGVNDTRDSQYVDDYDQFSREYAEHHPGQVAKLILLKTANLLSPNWRYHKPLSKSGLLLGILALPFPLWLATTIYARLKRRELLSPIIIWTLLLYILPFALTNSDPRFREPIDVLCIVDITRMIFYLTTSAKRP